LTGRRPSPIAGKAPHCAIWVVWGTESPPARTERYGKNGSGLKVAAYKGVDGKTVTFLPKEGPVMLVLSRKIGEEIIIDGSIRVPFVAVSGNKVRLGVTAPESVRVDRAEVHERRLEFITVEAKAESTHAVK